VPHSTPKWNRRPLLQALNAAEDILHGGAISAHGALQIAAAEAHTVRGSAEGRNFRSQRHHALETPYFTVVSSKFCHCWHKLSRVNAGVAQLVERDPSKVDVESSSLFSRSTPCPAPIAKSSERFDYDSVSHGILA
jgi:hypothetical protein